MTRSDEEHLRRFLAARGRGDAAEMRRWWRALLEDVYDRIDGLVAAYHKGGFSDEEHADAVQASVVRFSQRLMTTFEGTSMGELVNATRTLTHNICIDVQRASIRRRTHEQPTLDAGWNADREDGPATSGWEAEEAARRFAQDERDAEIRDFLAWAIPQLDDKHRPVLEMTFEGASIAEIVAALDITSANAYQRRSRALRTLSTLKEQYDR